MGDTIEELLRFEPPPQLSIRRFATEAFTVGGTSIARGDTVMLAWGSANRDPAGPFADPDVMRFDRAPNRHLGLGHGPHVCLGAVLARAELEIGLGTLLRRLPGLRVAGPAEWHGSFRNRGARALPVSAD
ncbi:cytochrome P450 [Pseudonocardia sp. HH130630-07]|uniref:cytochrome P450 n=1 Tax=Pseudonocardia sp. HH130630-07 TaxID=1690815 RepID=UPI001E37F819|nr:cytochrome P450 [Pseudonocardia sp. HH130630-07]